MSVGVALVVLAVSGTVAAVWPGVLKPLLGATPSTGSSPSVPATAATRPSVAASAVATDPFVLASGIAETWDLAVSRNGKVLVTHDRQSVRFFDLVGRRSLGGPLATSVGDIWSVALSPDGTLLAVGGKDGRLQLLDVAGRKPSGRTLTGPDPVSALDFSPDGRLLAAGHWEGEVTLWDVPARRSLGTLSNGRGGWLNTVEFSPDGRTIAAAGIAGATLWDVASRQRTHLAHDDPAYTAVFSPDGRTVATGTTRARVHLWDVRTGKRTAALDGKTDSSTDFVAFSPDGGWLVAKPLRIWNLGTRSVVARESWAGFVPSHARFTPDGRYLIAVRLEYGDVTLFDASWMG